MREPKFASVPYTDSEKLIADMPRATLKISANGRVIGVDIADVTPDHTEYLSLYMATGRRLFVGYSPAVATVVSGVAVVNHVELVEEP